MCIRDRYGDITRGRMLAGLVSRLGGMAALRPALAPAMAAPASLLRAPAMAAPASMLRGMATITQKTHSGTKKRFRQTGGGGLKRAQGGKRHLASSKTRKRINRLSGTVQVKEGKIKKTLLNALFN
eukprot:TRINITY_DN1553_c0_g1_i2.p1 TRINITY_DN1553_c0_g1~~TRINITY_DN1553_c0_g1_i2.p1  ORF type:complete len:126 (-),score=28.24 TRINITY_DN1553_c0_g1_i2:449-826(-)